MGSTVLVTREGKVVTIQLNRPESLNALIPEMGDELLAAVAEVSGDSTVRAVIITGTGRAFCAGGDIQFFAGWQGPKHEAFGILIDKFHRIVMELRQMPKPVIAAVNGVASGGGFSLAMACDLRIASELAKFKQAYTSIGLVPDGGWTISVARQIGMAKASELLLLDPVLTANEVLKLGLINQVVPPAELMEKAKALADLAASRSTRAFARSKALLNLSLGFGLADQLEAERRSIMKAADTEDFAEGLNAFLEKRLPRYI